MRKKKIIVWIIKNKRKRKENEGKDATHFYKIRFFPNFKEKNIAFNKKFSIPKLIFYMFINYKKKIVLIFLNNKNYINYSFRFVLFFFSFSLPIIQTTTIRSIFFIFYFFLSLR